MATATITFDALDYFTRLKEAGVPEDHAKLIADGLAKGMELQRAAFKKELDKRDEATIKSLATKEDLKEMELRLVKMQIRVAIGIGTVVATCAGALVYIMAKGFHWTGF